MTELAWGRVAWNVSGLQLQLDGILGCGESIDAECQWKLQRKEEQETIDVPNWGSSPRTQQNCVYDFCSRLSPCRWQGWTSEGSPPGPTSSSTEQISCRCSSWALLRRAGRHKDQCCLCSLCWTWAKEEWQNQLRNNCRSTLPSTCW